MQYVHAAIDIEAGECSTCYDIAGAHVQMQKSYQDDVTQSSPHWL